MYRLILKTVDAKTGGKRWKQHKVDRQHSKLMWWHAETGKKRYKQQYGRTGIATVTQLPNRTPRRFSHEQAFFPRGKSVFCSTTAVLQR